MVRLPKIVHLERFQAHLFTGDSRQETVVACQFKEVAPLISEVTYPVCLRHCGARWMSLITFDQVVTTAQVNQVFLSRREFAGGADALLGLFAEHSNRCFLQKMVALGQVFTPLDQPSLVLMADYGLQGRRLLTMREEQPWPEHTSFLGVDIRPALAWALW